MSVGRICVWEVDTAKASESVVVVAERMHQRSVGALVVVSDASQVVGILTDRDLTTRVLAKGLNGVYTAVHEVMTVGPKTILENTPVESALAMMRSGKFRRLPVVDGHNKLLGLVTLDDILMLLANELMQIGRLLERETPRGIADELDTSGIYRLQSEERISVGD